VAQKKKQAWKPEEALAEGGRTGTQQASLAGVIRNKE